jgi:phosphate-selective porin OprO/OprP
MRTLPPGRKALITLALLGTAAAVQAQAPESEGVPAPGQIEGSVPAALPGGYVVPDAPASLYKQTEVRDRFFTIKPGLVLIGDYTGVHQDANSIAQVGVQDSQGDVRAARLMFRGTLGVGYEVRYLIAGEYKGFDSDPDTTWSMTDVSLTFPLWGNATLLTVGKTKQTHSYEMVGDAANLPQMERVLSPFFVSRSIGARLSHVTADRLSTFSVGIYNDSWIVGKSSNPSAPNDGTDITARATRLMWFNNEGRDYLHLGVSVRRTEADSGILRYKGRPESNVLDNYVDTGNFAADHGTHLGLEGLWNAGPVSLLGEYIRAAVDAPGKGNPVFSGAYLTGSWFITGEHRPYDQTVGYARRSMPSTARGAIELVARVSYVDLDDAQIQGGSFTKSYLGANWWATPRWKFGAGWGRTWLDRSGMKGVTDAFLARVQWVY